MKYKERKDKEIKEKTIRYKETKNKTIEDKRQKDKTKLQNRQKQVSLEKNKMGVFLVDLLKLDHPGKGKQELYQDLIAVSAAGHKNVVRQYYIKKVTIILILLVTGIGLSAVELLIHAGTKHTEEMQMLERPDHGEGDRKEELAVWIDGEEEIQNVEVTIQERKYTKKEKEALLQNALAELEQNLPGDNQSLDEVRSQLIFPQSMANGAVSIMWITEPYGVISEDGNILQAVDEAGTLVEITGILTCEEEQVIYTSYARVFPQQLSEKEQFHQDIKAEVEKANEKEIYEDQLNLPDSVNGKRITWIKEYENSLPTILFLSLLVVFCVYIQMDQEVHKKAVKRKTQLLLDYPDLMWRMTMLLGAGLSIRGTFERIAQEYQKEQKRQRMNRGKVSVRYVYEEVLYTCYEMQSGISEAQAYERFGRRCQLPEYIRIGSVLSQNLKKGAKGLTSMLETEAEASLNDRKNNARKIGEKAGTKLLLPMILMLGVVLAILMIPAFLSF